MIRAGTPHLSHIHSTSCVGLGTRRPSASRSEPFSTNLVYTPLGTRSRCSWVSRSGMPGLSANASIRPFSHIATAADHARPEPRSIATMGRPAGRPTGRASASFQSSTVKRMALSSALGMLSLYDMKRAFSLLSPRAWSRSSRSLRWNSGETAVRGFAFLISDHWSHLSRSLCRSLTYVEPAEPPWTRSCHHPPLAGARVPMNSAFNGLPGLPVAVLMASNMASPSFTLKAPGSSQITHGVLTKPSAAFALLERT